jgi:histidine decarboxylase
MMQELSAKDRLRLEEFYEKLEKKTSGFLGYPVSKDFNYEALFRFLKFPLNNLGDPFVDSTYQVDSRPMEKEVLTFMAGLLNAPANNWWGYVTNGGSEGNLYGLYLARELHPKGMVYFSQSTHYSVSKNLQILNMPRVVIRSQSNGEIDYQDLRDTIRMNRHMSPIIFANIGTTMTEAKDDLRKIKAILSDLAIDDYYIHADGALSGMISPFLDPRPAFDFADGADSIAISGHKFIGSPIPCGMVLAKKHYKDRISRAIDYIGSDDTTITGSRNGFTPLVLWYAIKTLGKKGLARRVNHSLKMAAYAESQLKKLGLNAWRNPNAITVVFPDPGPEVRFKWQLATEKGISHLILMPNVTKEQIDEFIGDVKRSLEVKSLM